MTPGGGLSMLFHLVVILIKQKKKRLVSVLIILVIFGIIGKQMLASTKTYLGKDSNINYAARLLERCEPIKIVSGKNQVVLRVDDIQAFTWRETAIKMIEDAFENEMLVVLGVIPAGLQDDKKIYEYLKSNYCNLEIAQHGWDHRDNPPEFVDMSEEAVYEAILKGKLVLQELTKDPIVTFIPPHNIYSKGTEIALGKASFKIISGEGEGDFDYTTSTYDFAKDELVPIPEIIGQCKDGLEKNNRCIIMLHPQDYATNGQLDEEKYKRYLDLLAELKKLDVSFVKMKDLVVNEQ